MNTDKYGEWIDTYQPQENHIDDNASYDQTLFDSAGDEGAFVDMTAREYPANVWTLVETDGKMYIHAGKQHVNRQGYFITRVPAPDNFEPIPIDEGSETSQAAPETTLTPTIRALTDGLIELTNRSKDIPHGEILWNNDLIDELEIAYFHNAPVNPYQEQTKARGKSYTDLQALHELLIRYTNVYAALAKTDEPTYTADLRRDALVAIKALNSIQVPGGSKRYIERDQAIDAIYKLIPPTI